MAREDGGILGWGNEFLSNHDLSREFLMNWNKWRFSGILFFSPWILLLILYGMVAYSASRSHSSTLDFAVATLCFGFGAVGMLLSNVFGVIFHLITMRRPPENVRKSALFLVLHCGIAVGIVLLAWDDLIVPFWRNTVKNSLFFSWLF